MIIKLIWDEKYTDEVYQQNIYTNYSIILQMMKEYREYYKDQDFATFELSMYESCKMFESQTNLKLTNILNSL